MKTAFGMLSFLMAILWTLSALAVPDGIWKDVTPGTPTDHYAMYIQTYTEDSVVVILLDNSGEHGPRRFYAFLDSDYTDGIDAWEVGGADGHLDITSLEADIVFNAIFTGGDVSSAFELYRWFEAPGSTFSYLDGIYKDAPPFENTPFNMYLQTYDLVEPPSAIAVVTSDGGITYYAFLDPDITDGFSAEDILGSDAELQLVFSDLDTSDPAFAAEIDPRSVNDSSHFVLHVPDGSEITGNLYKWFHSPAIEESYRGSFLAQ